MPAATHGHTRGRGRSPEYQSWMHMRQRCYNTRHHRYRRYGARGIRVCERWRSSFAAFLRDMGPRPPGTTIGRKHNDRNYCKSNCRWESDAQQASNKPYDLMAWMKDRPRCARGHLFTPDNTSTVRPKRQRPYRRCRIGTRLSAKVYRQRHPKRKTS